MCDQQRRHSNSALILSFAFLLIGPAALPIDLDDAVRIIGNAAKFDAELVPLRSQDCILRPRIDTERIARLLVAVSCSDTTGVEEEGIRQAAKVLHMGVPPCQDVW